MLNLLLAIGVDADRLWLSDGSVVSGLVVKQTNAEIHFQVLRQPEQRVRIFPVGEVARIQQTIDPARLRELDPANPGDYRDMAEELLSFPEDSYARNLAQRLYLLSARWGSGALRESAFNGLIRLAENENAERRIRVLANQDCVGSEQNWLIERDQEQPSVAVQAGSNRQLAEIARLLRRHQFAAAADKLSGIVTDGGQVDASQIKLFQDVCTSSSIDNEQLLQIIQIELGFLSSREAETESPRQLESVPDFRLPDYFNITGFDPTECFFRNGKWQSDKNLN